MDLNINYYSILEVPNTSDLLLIKKNYYKLSKKYHPDKNPDDSVTFQSISESYSILSNIDLKKEYDTKSRWGKNYNEISEMLDFEFNDTSKFYDENRIIDFKKNEVLNIIYYVDDIFDGKIEYERWAICKDCKGSGKDLKSKIEVKDVNGNIRTFEAEDGCDFCDGSGKDGWGNECKFCFGQGQIGSKNCKTCLGNKRILGKQKLSNIEFDKDQKDLKIPFMGNFDKDKPGKVGHLWIVRKTKAE